MTPTNIPVTLSDLEWEKLVTTFMERVFLPESVETYRNSRAAGKDHTQAALDALRNEAANEVLINAVATDIVKQWLGDLSLDLSDLQPVEPEMPTMPEGVEFFDLDFDFPPEPQAPVPSPKQLVTLIWVTFQKEGIHCYPAAGTDPNLATGDEYDVSFLASPHRHIFHFRVGIEVFHDDRDIEFIQFKRWLERLYTEGTLELNFKSCEMIAQDLHAVISGRYPGRKMTIDVSEDGENGATILFDR